MQPMEVIYQLLGTCKPANVHWLQRMRHMLRLLPSIIHALGAARRLHKRAAVCGRALFGTGIHLLIAPMRLYLRE